MRVAIASLVLAVILILSIPANADIPQIINYQGKVTDSGGSPVADGDYSMTFTIYDDETSGTSQWSSGSMSVTVSNGIFSVLLGDTGQPTLDIEFDDDYWLETDIAGDTQSPRSRLGSVGYAYMASGLVPGTEVVGSVTSGTSAAIKGTNTATSGATYGVYGKSYSTNGWGVYGRAIATSGGTYGIYGESYSTDGYGVCGYAHAASGFTYGIYGQSSSTAGRGVYGYAASGTGITSGVYGKSISTSGHGLRGEATATTGMTEGVWASSNSTSGKGVFGDATATTGTTYGVYGRSASTDGIGVYGKATATFGTAYGGRFESTSTGGIGVYGIATAATGYNFGGKFVCESTSGYGVCGVASPTTGFTFGVIGENYSSSGRGVLAFGNANTGTNYGIFAVTNSGAGYAGYFTGDVYVNGNLGKSSGSFIIDHPLDPENRLLRHNFVESPENLLIYRGKARLDSNGEALVKLPDYFKALTQETEATVTVTPVGKPFIVGYDIEPNNSSFRIYGKADRTVSWVVYADRDDPVIRQQARPVEEEKGPDNKYCDKGKLLNPTAYGYPESMGRDFEVLEKERLQLEEETRRLEDERARMEEK